MNNFGIDDNQISDSKINHPPQKFFCSKVVTPKVFFKVIKSINRISNLIFNHNSMLKNSCILAFLHSCIPVLESLVGCVYETAQMGLSGTIRHCPTCQVLGDGFPVNQR